MENTCIGMHVHHFEMPCTTFWDAMHIVCKSHAQHLQDPCATVRAVPGHYSVSLHYSVVRFPLEPTIRVHWSLNNRLKCAKSQVGEIAAVLWVSRFLLYSSWNYTPKLLPRLLIAGDKGWNAPSWKRVPDTTKMQEKVPLIYKFLWEHAPPPSL